MTEKTDIVALREAALKATPGTWRLGIGSTYAYVQASIDMRLGGLSWVKLCHIGRAGWRNQQSTIDDARFIAMANPATIITLLDQLEVVSKSEWNLAGGLVEVQEQLKAERQRSDELEALALAMRDDIRLAREELTTRRGQQERLAQKLTDLPYDVLFNAIAKSVTPLGEHMSISVKDFKVAIETANIVPKDGE
ncbi:MAG: ead/Ea22-like family protein [Ewingella sp.]|nr:ead/Ea22-like family protein [Ewingella sp.]